MNCTTWDYEGNIDGMVNYEPKACVGVVMKYAATGMLPLVLPVVRIFGQP